ncbi:MAG: divalent-cation tolerance protein CutA [Betaproteobacteria bacterium]
MTPLLVITNCPDGAVATAIANAAVDAGIAACANILAPCRSIYRWQGAIETAEETPLLLKTCAERYGELETLISELHSYDVPEIIALPIDRGLPTYLGWLATETGEAR